MRLLMILALAGSTLPVTNDAAPTADLGWRHAETGISLLPRMLGLRRTAQTSATQSGRDVTAMFASSDGNLVMTMYVFRPAIADIGLWFDSAEAALQLSDTFRHAAPVSAAPTRFGVGRHRSTSSLRRVYDLPDGRYRSTALAVMPAGNFIVEIRMSAKTLPAKELGRELRRVISALSWPEFPEAARPATPVKACYTRRRSMASVPRTGWCREGQTRREYGTYRANVRAAGYVLALNDTGGIVRVDRSSPDTAGTREGYAVSLEDVEGAVSRYPLFAALPAPSQVWALINVPASAGTKHEKMTAAQP